MQVGWCAADAAEDAAWGVEQAAAAAERQRWQSSAQQSRVPDLPRAAPVGTLHLRCVCCSCLAAKRGSVERSANCQAH